jgi:uncharacterized XkdX family phage protein
MNWFYIAQRDYSIYQDKVRIQVYVDNGKITADQYYQITGETYATI